VISPNAGRYSVSRCDVSEDLNLQQMFVRAAASWPHNSITQFLHLLLSVHTILRLYAITCTILWYPLQRRCLCSSIDFHLLFYYKYYCFYAVRFYCKHLCDPKHVHCHLIYLRHYGSVWPEEDFFKSKLVAILYIDYKLMCFRLILVLSSQ
jgi:hypothetical protein